MPNTFFFSNYIQNKATNISHTTSPIRKITHSFAQGGKHMASNFASSIKAPFTGSNKLSGAANLGLEAANKANIAGGFLVGATATAAIAGSTAAFVAAVTGPQVAVTASVIGLAIMIRDAYSNREAAHEALRPYVYNLIDDTKPVSNNYLAAAAPAAYLLQEAKAQLDQMGQKLQERENQFIEFVKQYTPLLGVLTNFSGNTWPGDDIMRQFRNRNMVPPSDRVRLDHQLDNLIDECNKANTAADELLKVATREGGAVFEFIRRLEHVGNYLQCCSILDKAMFMKLSSQHNNMSTGIDPLLAWSGAQQYRKTFKDLGDKMESAQKNFQALSRFYDVNKGVIGT